MGPAGTTMLVEKVEAYGGYRYQSPASLNMLANDVTASIGLLPHRQTRTGGAPDLDDLRVRPGLRADPFQ